MKDNENKINDLGRLLLEGPTEPEAERELHVVDGIFPSYSASSQIVKDAQSEITDLRERVKALEEEKEIKMSIEKIATDLLWITVVAKELCNVINSDTEALRVRKVAYTDTKGDDKMQVQIIVTRVNEEFLDESVIEKMVKNTYAEADKNVTSNLMEIDKCYLEIAEHKKQLEEIAKQLWDLKQHKIRHDLIILFETIAEKYERVGVLKEVIRRQPIC